jgi:hypothetical protein
VSGLRYVDPDGNDIDLMEWGRRFEDLAGRTVEETEVRMPDGQLATVRTLWLGLVEPDNLRLRLFGTAVAFGERDPQMAFREVRTYDTKEDAEQGHAEVVVLLRAGTPPSHQKEEPR